MDPNNPICLTQLNHEQIMTKLSAIEKRMDADWPLIEATHDDLVFRNRIWGFIKFVGFGTAAGITIKLFEFLAS